MINLHASAGYLFRMRRRLQKYLPIVLIALAVQILAPVAACWATAIAASDPLRTAEICHDSGSVGTDQPGDQNGHHGGICQICCLAGASASVDAPTVAAFSVPYRDSATVAWYDQAGNLCGSRSGSNAQARGPPLSM